MFSPSLTDPDIKYILQALHYVTAEGEQTLERSLHVIFGLKCPNAMCR